MDEKVQQQVIQLVQAAMQGDQQAQKTIEQVMQAAQQGDQQATQIAQLIQAVAQQMQQQQQVQAARFGAKLNYIRSLKGLCPDGEEIEYYKSGGNIKKRCKKCEKKMQEGGETPNNPVDAFKCGRKMKKNSQGSKFKQTTKTNENGDITYTRTYPGNKPVSYTTSGEGEGYYSDHRGRAKVEDQDSLANVYHNGPHNPNFKTKNDKVNKGQEGMKYPEYPEQVKKVKTVITYPDRLEANERRVQYYNDGTHSVMNSGWTRDTGMWTASFRGRQGEFGDYGGTPKQQEIADSIHTMDFRSNPISFPVIKRKKTK